MVTIDRIGLEVLGNTVRALGLHRGSVRWAASATFGSDEALTTELARLLAAVPRRWWLRPMTVVAAGPGRCQVRRLTGLPAIDDAGIASALIRENTSRFFLRNGVPLVPFGAVRGPADSWWGAAAEAPLVEAVAAASRTARLHRVTIVPAMTVISPSGGDCEVDLLDGAVRVRATFVGGRVAAVRRLAEQEPSAPAGRVAEPLVSLGDEAHLFGGAFAAARADLSRVPVLRLHRGEGPLPRWRLVAAALALTVGITSRATAPLFAARLATHRANVALSANAEVAAAAFRAEEQLRLFRGSLDEISVMALRTPSRLREVAALARALPDSAVLVSLRLDSTGGTAVILARRLSMALGRIERELALGRPEVTGPVTREAAAGLVFERAVIRFRP